MRKRYWFLTVLVFCLGIALGVFGHMYWGAAFQPGVNQPEEKENATKVDAIKANSQYALPDPTIKGHDAGIGSLNPEDEDGNTDENQIAISKTEQDKIISDYKQSLGLLFDAWKAKDMPAFRSVIAGAYTGEIMENHVKKAEKYLPQGVGLYISDVSFDDVDIESADKYSATVNAIYRYTVRDYDLDEEYPFGEEVSHFVHVRANLIKMDSRWMITGETVI
jgi:hypothetical protein